MDIRTHWIHNLSINKKPKVPVLIRIVRQNASQEMYHDYEVAFWDKDYKKWRTSSKDIPENDRISILDNTNNEWVTHFSYIDEPDD